MSIVDTHKGNLGKWERKEMAAPRKKIPALIQKQVQAECGSRCPFCGNPNVATFEFHHIDGNPSNHALENLIGACGSCHQMITRSIISPADVATKKRELYWTAKAQPTIPHPSVNVQVQGSTVYGDIAQNMTKISTRRSSVKVPHPPGSIGANLPMKGYVDYLIGRYFQHRKADSSYGRATPFSHAVIHKNIETHLGARTFFLPEGKFDELVGYLKKNIDGTILGKANRAKGNPNYHSYEEHCAKHGFNATYSRDN